MERAAYDHRLLDAPDSAPFVRLSAAILNQLIPHYQFYIRYMVEVGILEADNHYEAGSSCRGYRLAEAYQSKVVVSIISEQDDRLLIRKHNQRQTALQQVALTQYPELIGWLAGLEMDWEAASAFIDESYQNSIAEATTAKQHQKALDQYNAYVVMIDRFVNPDCLCIIDEAGHRLHTKLTNLWSQLRQFITYQGQPLVSVDLSCSQPCLATCLLRPDFYELYVHNERLTLGQLPEGIQLLVHAVPTQIRQLSTDSALSSGIERQSRLTKLVAQQRGLERLGYLEDIIKVRSPRSSVIGSFDNKSNKSLDKLSKVTWYSLMLDFSPDVVYIPHQKESAPTSNTTFKQELELYINSIEEGRFYEVLGEQISVRTGRPAPTRKKLKQGVLSTLFSDNNDKRPFIEEARRIFQTVFPCIYHVLEELKARAHRDLPVLLQGIEAVLFLNRIAKRISQERPDLPLFTLHDSIITVDGYQDYVEAVMRDEISKATGIHPHFKQEKWAVEPIES